MKTSQIGGTHLEFEEIGSGEPVLLVSTGPITDSFLPFFSEGALSSRFRLIRYRQRQRGQGSHDSQPVSFARHAADAAGLLQHLEIAKAHVVGHSTGASIGLQLAVDRPDVVQTLALLEPPLPAAPSAADFFVRVAPALAAYEAGDAAGAMAQFLSVVCSLPWEECRAVVERAVPGGTAMALQNADNFFESYLPALGAWVFGPEQASSISLPVLSFLGSETDDLFRGGSNLLSAWLPQLQVCNIEGAAHLLHMQRPEPVTGCLSRFLEQNAIVVPFSSEAGL